MKEIATELLIMVAFLFGTTLGMIGSHFAHKWTIRFLGESLKDDVKDMSRSVHRNFEAVRNQLYQIDDCVCDIENELKKENKNERLD